ncbi:MAG: TetR/AcrR family transcriptional regulator [Bacteroidota bacterium]
MKASTAQYILEKVSPIFNRKGYIGTSLSDLTKATNMTKGAIYGNFKNKEDLALQAFKFNLKKAFMPLYKRMANEEEGQAKLLSMLDFYRHYYQQVEPLGGCPLINVGVDAQHINPSLFEQAQQISKQQIRELQAILARGMETGVFAAIDQPERLAKLILSMIEGASYMAFVHRDAQFILQMTAHLETWLKTTLFN